MTINILPDIPMNKKSKEIFSIFIQALIKTKKLLLLLFYELCYILR